MAPAVLERCAGQPQEQHVADQVQPSAVDERRGDEPPAEPAAGVIAEARDRDAIDHRLDFALDLGLALRVEMIVAGGALHDELGDFVRRRCPLFGVDLDERADRDDRDRDDRQAPGDVIDADRDDHACPLPARASKST